MDSEFVKRFLNQLGNDDNLFVVALDNTGTVTYANAKARERFCNPPGKLIGAKWVDVAILPEDRPRAKKRFAALLAGKLDGLAQIGDVDVLACDGSRLRILWSNHLLRESDGTISGILGFGQDITEQRRVQFRLGLHQAVARIIGESESYRQAVEQFLRLI